MSTPCSSTPLPTCASRGGSSSSSPRRATRSSSCRRSSTCRSPRRSSRLRRGGTGLLRLDPEPPHPGATRRREVGQPLAPARVHDRGVPRPARALLLPRRGPRPLPRPQAAGPRNRHRARLGPCPQGAANHQAVLRPIHPGDHRLGLRMRDGPRPGAGLRRGLSCVPRFVPVVPVGGPPSVTWTPVTGPAGPSHRDATVGDLAIVLHSHMPYVEGFGTYPFGEEWLFDAVRAFLPAVVGVRRGRDVHGDAGAGGSAGGSGGSRAAAGVSGRAPDPGGGGRSWGGTRGVPEGGGGGDRPIQGRAGVTRRCGGDPLRAFQAARPRGGWRLRHRRRRMRCCRCSRRAAGWSCSSTQACARIAAASGGRGGSGCPSALTGPASSGISRSTGWSGSASIRARWRRSSARWHRSPRRQVRLRRRSTGRRSPGPGR